MFNRPYNTVLARLGLVAAILATLMILAPAATAADAEYDYAENGEDPVATFSATDPDVDADDIEWSLDGPDKGLFEIDGGVLTFEDSPDFEAPADGDEEPDDVAGDQGKGDNVYKVTVVASGGDAGGCGDRDERGRGGGGDIRPAPAAGHQGPEGVLLG